MNFNLKKKERIIYSYVWETLDKETRLNSNTEDDEIFLSKDVKKAILEFQKRIINYNRELIELDTILEDIEDIFGEYNKK